MRTLRSLLPALPLCGCLAFAGLLTSGCPKREPPPPLLEEATRTVTTAADLSGANGIRATVLGTLQRTAPEGISAQGTAVILDDGTPIFLTEEAPPENWEWLIGTRVRVQGALWERAPSGWPVAKLLDAEPPLPADVSILLTP